MGRRSAARLAARILQERDVWGFQSGDLVAGLIFATSNEVDGLYIDLKSFHPYLDRQPTSRHVVIRS